MLFRSGRALSEKSKIVEEYKIAMNYHFIEIDSEGNVTIEDFEIGNIETPEEIIQNLDEMYRQIGGYPSVPKLVYIDAGVEF